MMTSSKKGVSSRQIEREHVTIKTAWFITHRIREAMKEQPLASMLKGAVEVDETHVGGKPRHTSTSQCGRGPSKSPVMVLVERDGRARCTTIRNIGSRALKGEVRKYVEPSFAPLLHGVCFPMNHRKVTDGERRVAPYSGGRGQAAAA